MAAYSIDLRQKILHAYERRLGSQRALANVFGVSLSFIEKVLRRYRTTGELGPKPHAGGRKPRLDAAAQVLIRQGARLSRCDLGRVMYLCGRYHRGACQSRDHVPAGTALGFASQKKSLHATERDTPRVQQARADYQQLMAALDVHRLKFVDESGVNLAMTRRYGRAPRGTRVIGSVPQNYGQNVTMLGALGAQGLQAVMTVEGATDAEVFRTYVKRVLGPTLRPGDIVVMDNLRAHKAVGVQQALARRGARLLYLPPYSPDLRRSSPVGQRSRPLCGRPRRAPVTPLIWRSHMPYQQYPDDALVGFGTGLCLTIVCKPL